jgi:ornithine lipid hydroxylase
VGWFLLRWLLFPVTLFGSLGAACVAIRGGMPGEAVTGGLTITIAIGLLLLQRGWSYRQDWRSSPPEFALDAAHTVLSTGLVAAVANGLVAAVGYHVAAWTTAHLGFGLWPAEWPLGAQLAAALLVGEFGQYWVHRLSHEVPSLWRIHALHHSSRQLYLLSAGRTHPLGVFLSALGLIGPLALLGAPPQLLLLLSVFTGINGLLQHANLPMALAPWNWLIATADWHRWHHAVDLVDGNANYGSNLMVFDFMFGTARPHRSGSSPAAVGLADMPNYPNDLLGQLATPFTWSRFAESPSEWPPQS